MGSAKKDSGFKPRKGRENEEQREPEVRIVYRTRVLRPDFSHGNWLRFGPNGGTPWLGNGPRYK